MIRVCDISKHRPKPEVTYYEVKVIWGHEVKLPISVIWYVYGSGFRLEREKRP